VGVVLPRYSVSQAALGRVVRWPSEPIRPGDLVFMRGGAPLIDLGHVGVAASPTEWIVAPHAGATVRLEAIPRGAIQRVRRYVD
jgi:cell wall-associated NlpC family hydrolase